MNIPVEHPAPTCELDRMALDEVAKRCRLGEPVTTLAIGVGAIEQAGRFGAGGALSTLAIPVGAAALPPCAGLRQARFDLVTAPELSPLLGEPYDVIVCQRVLHSLPYEHARLAIRRLHRLLKIGGKLFLSVYGLHSELGDNYPDSEKLVADRFAGLPPEIAQRYDIHGPACLYSERNLFTLLFEAGACIVTTSTSTLGNVRAVTVRI